MQEDIFYFSFSIDNVDYLIIYYFLWQKKTICPRENSLISNKFKLQALIKYQNGVCGSYILVTEIYVCKR